MMVDETRRWMDERNSLKYFLAQQGHNLEDIQGELLPQHFNGFIYALSEMELILNEAKTKAESTRDLELTGQWLANAKLQKDVVYDQLTLALGTPTRQLDLEGENSMTIIDFSKGGLESMERVWQEPKLGALRDYVMHRYDQGVNKCVGLLST